MIRRFPTILVVLALVSVPATTRAAAGESAAYDWAKWAEFWAFKPVVKPEPPGGFRSRRGCATRSTRSSSRKLEASEAQTRRPRPTRTR